MQCDLISLNVFRSTLVQYLSSSVQAGLASWLMLSTPQAFPGKGARKNFTNYRETLLGLHHNPQYFFKNF